MNRTSLALHLLVLLPLAGCTIHSSSETLVAGSDRVLARRERPDGVRETFRLDLGGSGSAQLRVDVESPREVPFLGLQAEELDQKRAQKRGVQPYQGLLVTGVAPNSSAQTGGVLVGDVLLALDDTQTVYRAQLETFAAGLRDGQSVGARVLRGQTQTELQLKVVTRRDTSVESQVVELDEPPTQRPRAGVVLRGIPAAWCERIYGQPREAVVVSSIEVGSPAWLAGVRSGDVIDRVDGDPVPDVHTLTQRVAAVGDAEGAMQWVVSRDGKAHEAELQLHDYSGETDVWFPLVFRYRDAPVRNRWGIGPFGSILHNTNRVVADDSTRAVRTRNEFGMLLNLIHVVTEEDETRVRLLWFIRFDT